MVRLIRRHLSSAPFSGSSVPLGSAFLPPVDRLQAVLTFTGFSSPPVSSLFWTSALVILPSLPRYRSTSLCFQSHFHASIWPLPEMASLQHNAQLPPLLAPQEQALLSVQEVSPPLRAHSPWTSQKLRHCSPSCINFGNKRPDFQIITFSRQPRSTFHWPPPETPRVALSDSNSQMGSSNLTIRSVLLQPGRQGHLSNGLPDRRHFHFYDAHKQQNCGAKLFIFDAIL